MRLIFGLFKRELINKINSLVLLGSLVVLSCSKVGIPPRSKLELIPLYHLENGKVDLLEDYPGHKQIIFWKTSCFYSVRKLREFSRESRNGIKLAVSLDELEKKNKVIQITKPIQNVKHFFSGNGTLDAAWIKVDGYAVPVILHISPENILIKVE